MPIRRGRYAPQNTFLETIAEKFDRGNSNFVLGSAQEQNNYPIVYCSDGFCELTGFSRSELMRRSCACNFLYGLESNQDDIRSIKAALAAQTELKKEIQFYKKNGSPFWCLLDIVPIKNENGNVVLFLASHKDISKRKFSGEAREDETASLASQTSGQGSHKLSRSKSRKFSRDVLLHLSRQYGQSTTANSKPNTRRAVKRTRSFSFTSERLPQYKRESTKKSKFLLVHYSTAKGLWDWGIILLTIYIAIMVPFNVAFQGEDRVRELVIIDMVIQMFFITDIVVHFRTTYVDPSGKIIYDQKKIAMHYLKSWFILDFLAALPFEALYFINQSWVSSTFNGKPSFNKGFLIQLLKCGRLVRLLRVIRKLHRYTDYSTVLLSLLMMAFALVAHWLACIWFVIGQAEIDNHSKVSWLYQLGESIDMSYGNFSVRGGPNRGSAYITALYFTLTSMTTVGFGNVSANTNGEKVFTVIVMLIGALMHAAIFGNVAAIIQKLYANRVRYHSRANEIKQFIRVQRIEQDLSNRLEDYFHNTWSLSGGVDTREILTTFPPELQAEVCMHMYRGMLELPAFSQASRGCLRMLSLQVRPVYVSPGELLVTQTDVVNALYYIASGSMEVLQGESVAAILGKGDMFGEDITRKMPIRRSNGDVRALTYCDIYYITRDRFHEVLHLYSDFAYKFTEKLELTYDLGASEKDIWRRGGLDSISEDDEEDEEDEKDEKEDEAITAKQNGACRSGRKARSGPSSPFYRRRNNFTSDRWKGLGRHSSEFKSSVNHVEQEPLLRGLSEDKRHALNRQCAVDVNVSGSGGTPQHSPNKKLDQMLSNQSLEWEKEDLSLHEDGEVDSDNEHGSKDDLSEGEEDGKASSKSSCHSTTSDLFDSKSPEVFPQGGSEFSKHLFISCDYPADIIHPSIQDGSTRVAPEVPDHFHTDDSSNSDSDGDSVLGSTEFQNPHHRDRRSKYSSSDASRFRDRNSPLLATPFSNETPLEYSLSMSDTGSVKRAFDELPFQCGASTGSSNLEGACISPDISFQQGFQDSRHSSKANLSVPGSPGKRTPSTEVGDDFESASFPGLSDGARSNGSNDLYENGCGIQGPLRQLPTSAKSPASSTRSLNERSPVPGRRRKQSSVIQPPILFSPLMLNATNPYKDFVPPSRESLVSSCIDSASSKGEVSGGETENHVGGEFYTSETTKDHNSEDETERTLPFVPAGDRDTKLYGKDRDLSTVSSSPSTTDFSIASPGATSEALSTEFRYPELSNYEENYYFSPGVPQYSRLTGARSTRSMKCDETPADFLSPPRPIRSSFSEPHLHRPAVVSEWKTLDPPRDENSNIRKQESIHESMANDCQQLSTEQLEDIFRDVTNARDAMEKLQTILCSPEPDICTELADTKQTVQRLDRQVFDLNKEVSSLSSDIKTVLELLRGLSNDQAVG